MCNIARRGIEPETLGSPVQRSTEWATFDWLVKLYYEVQEALYALAVLMHVIPTKMDVCRTHKHYQGEGQLIFICLVFKGVPDINKAQVNNNERLSLKNNPSTVKNNLSIDYGWLESKLYRFVIQTHSIILPRSITKPEENYPDESRPAPLRNEIFIMKIKCTKRTRKSSS